MPFGYFATMALARTAARNCGEISSHLTRSGRSTIVLNHLFTSTVLPREQALKELSDGTSREW
jgi:hypothetical protein